MKTRWTTMAVAVALALALSSGCTTVAKQGYYTVTGASARYYEVQSLGGPQSLLPYGAVQVETFSTAPMMGAIPAAIPEMVKADIEQKVGEIKHIAETQGKTLTIRGKFVDYDPGGSALRAVGFGVNPFLTAQIEVVDAGTGQTLGVAMVTGTAKSALRGGEGDLAEGVAKAVKGLLDAHMKTGD